MRNEFALVGPDISSGRFRKLSNPHLALERATGQIMRSDLAERFVEGSRSSDRQKGYGKVLGLEVPATLLATADEENP
jgi:hypothetical protein